MRKVIRLLGILGVAALVIAVATPASANCIPAKTATTFLGADFQYWTIPGGVTVNEASLRGQFWQQGNRAAGNEGTCTVSTCGGAYGWLYFFGGQVNMNANLGDGSVAGCAANRLITVAQVDSQDGKHSFFIAGTVDEIPAGSGGAVDFPYSTQGSHSFVEIPKPVIRSASRAGSTLNLVFDIPGAQLGAFGPGAATAIAGYRLVQGTGTSNADPGRGSAGYTLLQSVTGPATSVAQPIDCTGISPTQDKYVGLQILFSDGVVSNTGATYRVGCDPSLANPKYKIVPKKNAGAPTMSH